MSGINKRVFGTPIKGSVREVLEFRQGASQTTNQEGESELFYDDDGNLIEATLPEISVTSYQKPFKLDERLPFVRMWTSVKLIEPSKMVDISKMDYDEAYAEAVTKADQEGYSKGSNQFMEYLSYFVGKAIGTAVGALGTVDVSARLEVKNPGKYFVPIKEPGSDKIIGYSVQKFREQVEFARKIYEVGNHTYQKNYGQVDPNESVGSKIEVINKDTQTQTQQKDYDQRVDEDGKMFDALFPNELRSNPYIKPQAGITSVSSETEGALGLTKKTTVNFLVHNFQDYDNIYNKYFLKPGATLFVDFGWGDIPYLYRPEELINSDSVQDFLYEKDKGFISKNEGNVEVLQGIVTDYSSKVLKNGSVECSVTITSSNNALLTYKLDSGAVAKVKNLLQNGLLYFALLQIASDNPEQEELLYSLQSTPNSNDSAEDILSFENHIKFLGYTLLSDETASAPGGLGSGAAVRTGVFTTQDPTAQGDTKTQEYYIAWGLFEDLIINSQFGFGKSEQEINSSKGFEVSIDSSTSYTKWARIFIEKQGALLKSSEKPPVFLYPEWWGGSDPLAGATRGGKSIKKEYLGDSQGGSYSFQKGKFIEDNYSFIKNSQYYPRNQTYYDKNLNGSDKAGRIPIREVFIRTDVIIAAFEGNDTIQKAVNEVLEKINEESGYLFGWSLVTGADDSKLRVIDKNYKLSDNEIRNVSENAGQEFTFNVMSPTSIVKDYDLEFKLPSGNIGNMYAIQAMSHDDMVFSTDSDINSAIETAALDPDSLSIIYEPDNGSKSARELLDRSATNDDLIYDTVTDIMDTDSFNVQSGKSVYDLDAITPLSETVGVAATAMQTSADGTDLIAINDDIMTKKGLQVATSFADYYKLVSTKQASTEKSALLPYTLSLTTYGISSLQCGDTFKVDYLPKAHLDNTQLQIVKIIQEVGPAGWYTALETQYKLNPDKLGGYTKADFSKIRLSAGALNNQTFEEELDINDSGFFDWSDTEFGIKQLAPYMTDCRIRIVDGSKFNYIIEFNTTAELGKGFDGGAGEVQNEDTGFYSQFDTSDQGKAARKEFSLSTDTSDDGFGLYDNYSAGDQYYYLPRVTLYANSAYALFVWNDKIGLASRRSSSHRTTYEKLVKYFAKYLGENR